MYGRPPPQHVLYIGAISKHVDSSIHVMVVHTILAWCTHGSPCIHVHHGNAISYLTTLAENCVS